VSLGGDLPSWRRGPLVVPPAGQLGLTTLLIGGPGVGKSTAAERIAHLAARERRHLCVIDGKGTDGLAESIAAAVLAAWPDARIRSFPNDPVDLWRGTPQQLANRLVATWSFSQKPSSMSRRPCSGSAWP
jgi:MoxR-like ATPase